MGAHNARRRTWALGRWRWLNRTLEALFVIAIVAAAAFAGWVTHEPARTGSILNPPVVHITPSRPADPDVAPVRVHRDPPPTGTIRRKD